MRGKGQNCGCGLQIRGGPWVVGGQCGGKGEGGGCTQKGVQVPVSATPIWAPWLGAPPGLPWMPRMRPTDGSRALNSALWVGVRVSRCHGSLGAPCSVLGCRPFPVRGAGETTLSSPLQEARGRCRGGSQGCSLPSCPGPGRHRKRGTSAARACSRPRTPPPALTD